MAVTVDARGLPCPQPVILTRDALRENEEVVTIVDNDTACHNVVRMAQKEGHITHVEEREDSIVIHIRRGEPVPKAAPARSEGTSGPLVVVIPSESMGRGEHPELGQILIRGFFHTLGEVEPLPDALVFFNSGVKLVVEGSPVLEDLQALAQRGVEILACGTCLGYYELKEKVAVGEVSNMYTIVETLLNAGRVVSL